MEIKDITSQSGKTEAKTEVISKARRLSIQPKLMSSLSLLLLNRVKDTLSSKIIEAINTKVRKNDPKTKRDVRVNNSVKQ